MRHIRGLTVLSAVVVATAACSDAAWLYALGLTIEVRSATELEADDDDRSEGEVEGIVASVDLGTGRVTLAGGAVIRVTDASAFDDGHDAGDDEHLTSLAAVQAALDAGQTVKAEAHGAVESTSPVTILAHEVEFEVEDETGGDGNGRQGQGVEFEQAVQSADPGAGTFTLANGVTVKLTDATVISGRGDLFTLQAVADAKAAGKLVRAEGTAIVESAGPPATIVALTVKWEVDD
jgi:hypothetical protein